MTNYFVILIQKLENNGQYLLSVAVLSFNIYTQLCHNVKTHTLNYNAWKQKMSFLSLSLI